MYTLNELSTLLPGYSPISSVGFRSKWSVNYMCRAVTRGAAGAARAAPLFRPIFFFFFFFFFDFIEITENYY